ncbi:unnamed protein product [Withania somnifera]
MYTPRQIAVTLSLPLLITALVAVSFAAVDDGSTSLTAYDLLKSYDFPVGILPKGVTGYDLDKTTGKFSVHLNRYKSTFGGYIAKDRLTSLYGVSVKILFLWLNIVEVTKNGDDLQFSVGIASASFPLDNFLICPQCGCGLNCNSNSNGHILRVRNSHLVSSI